MLSFIIEKDSVFASVAEKMQSLIEEKYPSVLKDSDALLTVSDDVTLSFHDDSSKVLGSSFSIDILNDEILWRLRHSGRSSEPVCKAVIGKLENPVVFDATAGLGRESLILQNSGAKVHMFERNPIIYLMLFASLHKSKSADKLTLLKNSLPVLSPYGSVLEVKQNGELPCVPDVIYYDPMFPQRKKSALVKREMRIFHELVGFDEDTVETANELLKICKHHLVVKRPSNEAPLELNVKRSSFIDGKACRFDCYYVKND
ncbi:MAG: class I SAM-dependent methyltransferase [Succinivibrio sp.]|uniref:class I SAM-dependent methyltransferase n=1 Tax=Succinivibrio sp. TaxID=2053619 RepID=UPI002F9494EF